jgi:hypothetical protein
MTADATTPQARVQSGVQARIAALRAKAGIEPPDFVLTEDLERLVLIGSSSRGGSSIFSEVLRRTVDAVHLRAESNPFLRLYGLGPQGLAPRGEALDAQDGLPAELFEALAWECGRPWQGPLDAAAERAYALDLACRLSLQWPEERFELAEVEGALVQAGGAGAALGPSAAAAFVAVLKALMPAHNSIDPTLYDLDQKLVFSQLPEIDPARRLPPVLLEEPPFVAIAPWRRATRASLRGRPLIIKTPGNAYRMPWFRSVLPHTRVDLLHLRRNVAASVNGLFDGWRHRGFHAHRVDGALAITGYSDQRAEGRDWWKFDLPPGWTALRQAPLQAVCAFQWRSAHQALLETARDMPPEQRRSLHFEDFTADPRPAVVGLLPWLQAPLYPGAEATLSAAFPAVMATRQPRHRRWFARATLLEEVLTDPRNLGLMAELGYDANPETWT